MTQLLDPAARPIARSSTARPTATRRENLLTVAFATWLIVGIFVDGWAHSNDKPESFFTPWHGLFYSGFLATAAWMLWMVQRRRRAGASALDAIPVGYGLGLLGVAIFAFGGAFDMAWHQIFGIEVDLEALLSPSHLVLFAGGLLVSTSPLRSAWADPASQAPTFRQFLPALASTTAAVATVAFFLMDLAPTLSGAVTTAPYRFIAMRFAGDADTASWMVEEVQIEGYAAILVTTVVLLAPVLLLARRWRLPFGTFTFVLGLVSTLVAGIESFDMGWAFASAAVGGLAGDLLYRRLEPAPERPGQSGGNGPERPWRLRAVAALVPAVMWLAYFAIVSVPHGLGWSVELWSGVCVMTAITGFGLSLLVVPPPVPSR